jgi:predicted phosphohydrolase
MRLWAIADLHLSHARPDPRERFAGRWRDHAEKIATAWRETVSNDDLVLLPGDISMARNHRDLQPDLVWLDRLPGRKVLSPGNHDLWFNSADRVRRLLRRSLFAVGGDALKFDNVIVCGAKGAPVPLDDPGRPSSAQNQALAEIDRALSQALDLRSGSEPILVLWHYPPFDPLGRPGPIVPRLESAGASACVYGHLHQQGQWSSAVQGVVGSVLYHCVAADSIGFRPLPVRIRQE